MSFARYLLASFIVASLAMGCDLNPQPLPPGDEPEGGAAAASPGNNANGGTGGDAGGTSPPEVLSDASLDAPGGDGALDATLDGAGFDGESDASLDAANASD
jgi:hypothetical protein